MTRNALLATLAACFIGTAAAIAADPIIGHWKPHETPKAGAAATTAVVYEMVGDRIKGTVIGVDGDGKPTRSEWTGKFDGKEYPVIGDATADMRAYTRVDDHATTYVQTKGGKTVETGKVVVSADGKHRTVTSTELNAQGRKTTTTTVYDRQ